MDKNGNYIDENGNIVSEENKVENLYGFQMIASTASDNIYKLYNNGDLYGKGLKNINLQSNLEDIDSLLYKELTLPSSINVSKIICGNSTIYYIDDKSDLYAIGVNSYNKLGLTQDQQIEYTGRELTKINVDNKKVQNVFDGGDSVFVVTTDNKLYGAGDNNRASLGLGHRNVVDSFTEITIDGLTNPSKIFSISASYWNGCMIWYNDAPDEMEEYSESWAEYNQFYYSGFSRWGFGGINKGSTPQYLNFNRIWDGNDGDDIDQDILYCSIGSSPWILKSDGSVMQSGYGGAGIGSGWVGGGSSTSFKTRSEAVNQKFIKMWYGNGSFILLHENGELWGVSSDNISMIGDSTRDWVLNKLENVPFDTSNLVEVLPASNGIFYLLDNGEVYFSGNYKAIGLGNEWNTKIDGIVCLNELPYNKSFPQIKTLYGDYRNGGRLLKGVAIGSVGAFDGCNVFCGLDGKYYLCNSSGIMFGNDILEKNWTLIAKDVNYFEPTCPSYVSRSGDVFVAGEHSDYLGLNYESDQKILKFTELTDPRVKGKAIKVQYDNNVLAILTNDGILYATGLYYNNNVYYYPGYSEPLENTKTLTKVDENVKDIAYRGTSRLYLKNDNSLLGFGYWRGHIQDASANTPTLSTTITSNISTLKPLGRNSFVIDEDGTMWYSGDNGYSYCGMNANKGDYIIWTGDIEEEKVKDTVCLSGETHIVLTESGNLYGWGQLNKLGIGTSSIEISQDIRKLPISDVNQIVAGKGFFIAVKKDGSVWGTGENMYGVLGRWKGSDRTLPNSRYRTAFEWVECPELEI